VENHAVVIGAGMAGLVAGRVLSDRFATVTVLDRDTLPVEASPRRGVPQSSQPHILLVSGLRELTGLFPGFDDELVAAGGTPIDLGTDLCTFRYGRRWPQEPCGYALVSISRPQLESLVRARLEALPGVSIRDRVTVSALAGADGTVTGVVLDSGETIAADLIVDCSGRGSRSDRWLIMLGGWHMAGVPTDVETFEAAAKALPDPIVGELMKRATPLSDVVVHRFPSNRRRLFENLERPPVGYVALGDAICSFNPVYGQGMTCAAREAVALGAALDEHDLATFARP
jgi:2-polyprenyl-6-methoxyphenol hydroxylase-like FAD-dependent oxidoreductase